MTAATVAVATLVAAIAAATAAAVRLIIAREATASYLDE